MYATPFLPPTIPPPAPVDMMPPAPAPMPPAPAPMAPPMPPPIQAPPPVPPAPIKEPPKKEKMEKAVKLMKSAQESYKTPDIGPGGMPMPSPNAPSAMPQAMSLKPGWGGGQ